MNACTTPSLSKKMPKTNNLLANLCCVYNVLLASKRDCHGMPTNISLRNEAQQNMACLYNVLGGWYAINAVRLTRKFVQNFTILGLRQVSTWQTRSKQIQLLWHASAANENAKWKKASKTLQTVQLTDQKQEKKLITTSWSKWSSISIGSMNSSTRLKLYWWMRWYLPAQLLSWDQQKPSSCLEHTSWEQAWIWTNGHHSK